MALFGKSSRRAVLIVIACVEFALAFLFYAKPQIAFAILGRPVLDPVISRQYGLFLCSVALMYAIIAADPLGFRKIIWIGVAQRVFEATIAFVDWRAHEIPASSFLPLLIAEIVAAFVLAACAGNTAPTRRQQIVVPTSSVWLKRALIGFGGLQLFWAVLSTIFVQFGSRLLGWHIRDAYTTQQQGIALMVIGLTSLAVSTDPRRYRPFIWIPISSQLLGVANAVNELRLGTITLTIALIQWAIQAAIIAILLRLSRVTEPKLTQIAPVATSSSLRG